MKAKNALLRTIGVLLVVLSGCQQATTVPPRFEEVVYAGFVRQSQFTIPVVGVAGTKTVRIVAESVSATGEFLPYVSAPILSGGALFSVVDFKAPAIPAKDLFPLYLKNEEGEPKLSCYYPEIYQAYAADGSVAYVNLMDQALTPTTTIRLVYTPTRAQLAFKSNTLDVALNVAPGVNCVAFTESKNGDTIVTTVRGVAISGVVFK